MATTKINLDQSIPPDEMLAQTKTLCDSVAKHRTEDTQALFGDLHKMATLYYRGALSQANHSFLVAQFAAGIGTTLVFVAGAYWIEKRGVTSGLSALTGVAIQVISGLNFYLYRKATKQFELFHVCLERMGRYLMANSICANIDNPNRRDEARAELATLMAKAPMLPAECVQDIRQEQPQSNTVATAKPITTV